MSHKPLTKAKLAGDQKPEHSVPLLLHTQLQDTRLPEQMLLGPAGDQV